MEAWNGDIGRGEALNFLTKEEGDCWRLSRSLKLLSQNAKRVVVGGAECWLYQGSLKEMSALVEFEIHRHEATGADGEESGEATGSKCLLEKGMRELREERAVVGGDGEGDLISKMKRECCAARGRKLKQKKKEEEGRRGGGRRRKCWQMGRAARAEGKKEKKKKEGKKGEEGIGGPDQKKRGEK